VKQRLTSC